MHFSSLASDHNLCKVLLRCSKTTIDCPLQVKALTREVGTLREDLRREAKKRERAVARSKECEDAFQEASSRSKALEYANK